MYNNFFIISKLGKGFCQRKLKIIFLCILILGGSISARADNQMPAVDWVKSMANAINNKNYSQIFIYENKLGISTIRLSHAKINNHTFEKIFFLNGSRREYVKKDKQLAVLSQNNGNENKSVPTFSDLPFTKFTPVQWKKIQQFYTFNEQGTERIADRPSIKITIQPKDKFRYGYHLWIDKNTKLLLRVELFDGMNTILDRFMVTQMTAPANLTENDFEWPEKVTETKSVMPSKNDVKFPWNISWLPDGFTHINSNIIKSPVNETPVNYALFSDGLSTFSIYIEKDLSKVLSQSAENFGATSAVSRVFKTGKNAYYNVTIIGELPVGVAERIAASVQTRIAESKNSE